MCKIIIEQCIGQSPTGIQNSMKWILKWSLQRCNTGRFHMFQSQEQSHWLHQAADGSIPLSSSAAQSGPLSLGPEHSLPWWIQDNDEAVSCLMTKENFTPYSFVSSIPASFLVVRSSCPTSPVIPITEYHC